MTDRFEPYIAAAERCGSKRVTLGVESTSESRRVFTPPLSMRRTSFDGATSPQRTTPSATCAIATSSRSIRRALAPGSARRPGSVSDCLRGGSAGSAGRRTSRPYAAATPTTNGSSAGLELYAALEREGIEAIECSRRPRGRGGGARSGATRARWSARVLAEQGLLDADEAKSRTGATRSAPPSRRGGHTWAH